MRFLNEKLSTTLIVVGILTILISLAIFLFHEVNLSIWNPIDQEKFSQYGDFIGGVVGSLWALAGVILFYVALREQRKDLKINQQALSHQIEEFSLQRKELEETRWVLAVQKFDSTFFNLLHAQRELLSGLEVQSTKTKTVGNEKTVTVNNHKGLKFIAHVLYATNIFSGKMPDYKNVPRDQVKSRYIDYLRSKKELSNVGLRLLNNIELDGSLSSRYKLGFLRYYLGFYSEINNYVVHLTQILKFIEDAINSNKGKEKEFIKYFDIVKAQLSYKEKKVIFLVVEIEKVERELVERSGVLKLHGQNPLLSDEGF